MRYRFFAVLLVFSPLVSAAPIIDVTPHLKSEWFGLYLNGIKVGYANTAVSLTDDGHVAIYELAHFKINMVGIEQEMNIRSDRTYSAEGALLSIASRIVDPVGNVSGFTCRAEGDQLHQTTNIGGLTSEDSFPLPNETLVDALRHAHWVQQAPKVGDTLSFSIYEPLYRKEMSGVSHIVGIEERNLEGVATKVYKIKTSIDLMGIDSISYVNEDGTTLEDVTSGIITMRLEAESVAKDVNYSNDVIVSNAAMIDKPIENPRDRDELRLILRGPLTDKHFFNDERQFLQDRGDHVRFRSTKITADGIEAASLPITDPALQRWLKPTPFIQSDDARIVAKAKEIIGDETDAIAVSSALYRVRSPRA
jgi:hypothetical protein